ncbi:unnamed protein product [Paramecium pentaurelia]|uniref:Uncharacterized protein n=1 Tax=Paramecium pentaurelia TaxID=43138 RepID=A0A8S1YI71_9CILI|nr:unnamed protein product [Paramecium pentaurelia]
MMSANCDRMGIQRFIQKIKNFRWILMLYDEIRDNQWFM